MMAARAAFVALCCAIGALGFAPSAHTARSPRGLVAQSAVDVSEAVTVTVEQLHGASPASATSAVKSRDNHTN